MGGLARICKMYGSMKATGADGKSYRWVYDYAADAPVLEDEMPTGGERWKASERAKYADFQKSKEVGAV